MCQCVIRYENPPSKVYILQNQVTVEMHMQECLYQGSYKLPLQTGDIIRNQGIISAEYHSYCLNFQQIEQDYKRLALFNNRKLKTLK